MPVLAIVFSKYIFLKFLVIFKVYSFNVKRIKLIGTKQNSITVVWLIYQKMLIIDFRTVILAITYI